MARSQVIRHVQSPVGNSGVESGRRPSISRRDRLTTKGEIPGTASGSRGPGANPAPAGVCCCVCVGGESIVWSLIQISQSAVSRPPALPVPVNSSWRSPAERESVLSLASWECDTDSWRWRHARPASHASSTPLGGRAEWLAVVAAAVVCCGRGRGRDAWPADRTRCPCRALVASEAMRSSSWARTALPCQAHLRAPSPIG